jgi:uncharacterized membrane protein YczE
MSEVKYSKKEQLIGIGAIMIFAWFIQFLYNLYLQPKGMYVSFLEVMGIISIFMMGIALFKTK